MTDREFIKRLADSYQQRLDNQWSAFEDAEDECAEEWFGHCDDCLDKGIEFGNNEIYKDALNYLESIDVI